MEKQMDFVSFLTVYLLASCKNFISLFVNYSAIDVQILLLRKNQFLMNQNLNSNNSNNNKFLYLYIFL